MVQIEEQSSEISGAVSKGDRKVSESEIQGYLDKLGAGDQGIMFGYATDETPELFPLTTKLAHDLLEGLSQKRKSGEMDWLRPDSKSQVTIEYKTCENGSVKPLRIHTVLISHQHREDQTNKEIEPLLTEQCKSVLPKELLDERTKYIINPSGSFTIGGPQGDAGLTGRKIIVDTYGGWGAHGGGAFSGKDPSKVDRSAAYAARWVAKSLVAEGLCNRVLVQLSYGIGIAEPLSIFVNSQGTVQKGLKDSDLNRIIADNFDLRPGHILKDLDMLKPKYQESARYGHFGRNRPEFLWEKPKTLKQ